MDCSSAHLSPCSIQLLTGIQCLSVLRPYFLSADLINFEMTDKVRGGMAGIRWHRCHSLIPLTPAHPNSTSIDQRMGFLEVISKSSTDMSSIAWSIYNQNLD